MLRYLVLARPDIIDISVKYGIPLLVLFINLMAIDSFPYFPLYTDPKLPTPITFSITSDFFFTSSIA